MTEWVMSYQWLLSVFSSITNEFGKWGFLGIALVGLYVLRLGTQLFRKIFR